VGKAGYHPKPILLMSGRLLFDDGENMSLKGLKVRVKHEFWGVVRGKKTTLCTRIGGRRKQGVLIARNNCNSCGNPEVSWECPELR